MAATKAESLTRAMQSMLHAWIASKDAFARRVQPSCTGFSRKQTGNNTGGHGAGELLIEPLKLVRELVVVDAQAVENGRIEIPYRDWILDHVVAVVIGLTVGDARAHSAARHPRGVATRMMIASVVILREASLTVDGAAEFTRPDHQRVVEHAPLFQVSDQR